MKKYTLVRETEDGGWIVSQDGVHSQYWPYLQPVRNGSIIIKEMTPKLAAHIVEAMNRGEVEDWMQAHLQLPYDLPFNNDRDKA